MAEPASPLRREALIASFAETSAFTETYGFAGSQGRVFLEGQLLRGEGRAQNRTVLIFIHPASTLNLMPMPQALVAAGHDVLCAASRYAKNDTALIMEKAVADLGAWVRHARENLGYDKVVLAGWSGGGSLAAFYQAQAEAPTLTDTAAGDPYDLAALDLVPADALMLIAAHTGRARILSEWIDPSVGNEHDPDDRNPELDLYHHAGPKPPYSPDFLAAFRAAQKARIARITERVEETLATLRRRGGAEMERAILVHRTMADPRWLDPTLEPNGRRPGWCYLGNPETVNAGPVGLGRFSTLRAWLSQWSPAHSRADAAVSIASVRAPLLIVENGADDAVPTSHPRLTWEAATMDDRTYREIAGAGHYYRGQPAEQAAAVEIVTGWLAERGLYE
ncbi:MAG: alpha/beta hydrolase [Pararhodobacter sp.]|nr:alpha/beta hydrolase [Pararhodobacter sp.]